MKNKLFCLPAIPLLLQLSAPIEYISLLIITVSLIFLILRSVRRMEKKIIIKDSLFWILSIITFAAIIFAVSTALTPKDSLSDDTSYLLAYVFSFAVLFLGLIILKSFSVIKIKKITLVVLGILLFLFVASYCLRAGYFAIDGPPTSTGSRVNGFNPPSNSGFTNPIGGGCGGFSIF